MKKKETWPITDSFKAGIFKSITAAWSGEAMYFPVCSSKGRLLNVCIYRRDILKMIDGQIESGLDLVEALDIVAEKKKLRNSKKK